MKMRGKEHLSKSKPDGENLFFADTFRGKGGGKVHSCQKPAGEKKDLCIWDSKQGRRDANSLQSRKNAKMQIL